MSYYKSAPIIEHKCIEKNHFLLTVKDGSMSSITKAGQFYLLTPPSPETILKRPVSVFDVNKEKQEITFYYKIFGKGTKYLSQLPKGSNIEILGPLGRGFKTDLVSQKILIVGAGIGIAPFQYLNRLVSKQNEVHLLFGAKGKSDMGIIEYFNCQNKYFCSDDGSIGKQANVVQETERLLKEHKSYQFSYIYSCGPNPVLKSVGSLALKHQIKCQLSLETHMACGIRACAACSLKTQQGMKKICADGPVFNVENLILGNI